MQITANSQGPLLQWYATPLTREAAMSLKRDVEYRLHVVSGKQLLRLPQLSLMCARYWLEEFTGFDFELLSQGLAKPRRLQALLHLVYGQLLLARKIEPAFDYLDKGLQLVDGLLRAPDYFELYNRREQLRTLLLTRSGTGGSDFRTLMNEARVIEQLTRGQTAAMTFAPAQFDTLINKAWN